MSAVFEWVGREPGDLGQFRLRRPFAVGPQRFQAPMRVAPVAFEQFGPYCRIVVQAGWGLWVLECLIRNANADEREIDRLNGGSWRAAWQEGAYITLSNVICRLIVERTQGFTISAERAILMCAGTPAGGRLRIPPRTLRGTDAPDGDVGQQPIDTYYRQVSIARSAGPQRFQAPVRATPGALPSFVNVKVFTLFGGNRVLRAQGTATYANYQRALAYSMTPLPGFEVWPSSRGLLEASLVVSEANLATVVRLLGFQEFFGEPNFAPGRLRIPPRSLRGTDAPVFEWLGEPDGMLGQTYPWRQSSPETRTAQQEYNAWARTNNYCTIPEDGVLGPGTCGALAVFREESGYGGAPSVGGGVPDSCQSFNLPPRPPNCGGGGGGGGGQTVPDCPTCGANQGCDITTGKCVQCAAGQVVQNNFCVAVAPTAAGGRKKSSSAGVVLLAVAALFGIGAAIAGRGGVS